MSRTVSLLGGVLCLGLAGHLYVRPTPDQPTEVRPTGLVVEPGTADLGEVGQNETHPAQFKVTNYLTRTVTLGGIGKTCGCTTAELDRHTLGPGESATLATLLRTGTKQGRSAERLTVVYQDGSEGAGSAHSVDVCLVAVVVPDLLPIEQVVSFTTGRPAEFVLKLRRRAGADTARLIAASASHPSLSVALQADGLAVVVRYDGSRPDVAADRPEVRIQSLNGVGSVLSVPVRIGS